MPDMIPVCYDSMLSKSVSLNATTPVAIRCGDTNMAGRKWLFIQVATNVNIFIGSKYLVSGVKTDITKDVLARQGLKLKINEKIWLPVSENITVYGIAQSGAGKRLRILEMA